MSELHIRRDHHLGLKKARELAQRWAHDAHERLEMQCHTESGADHDLIHFERSGVNGHLEVAADHFELRAQLGMMVGLFAGRIRQEIEDHLDALLAQEQAHALAHAPAKSSKTAAHAPKKAASKAASKRA